ncbi:hypothetical protein GQR58_030102 [Nymphon striatum]|nr:hypothetical protein GQR58_030102 [Nymphon striatum]
MTDDAGNTYAFSENEPGEYVSESVFSAQQNISYQLTVETSDQQTYSSESIRTPEVAQIENLYVEREMNDQGVRGACDPDRWYEVGIKPRTEQKKVCFASKKSLEIMQASTNQLSSNELSRFQVRFIDRENYIMSHRYSILVKQFTQNLEAHSYFENLNKFSSSESVFTDIQPGFLAGNITSDINSDTKVLGYFEVTSVDEQRVYFNYEDLFPGESLPPYAIKCTNVGNPQLINRGYHCDGPFVCDGDCDSPLIEAILAEIIVFAAENENYPEDFSGAPYLTLPSPCGDCTKLGTSCVEPFEFEVRAAENVLVVEATITDELVKQQIIVSRASNLEEIISNTNEYFVGLPFRPIEESVINPERNANVSITDDQGNVFSFSEAIGGIYESDIAFAAMQGVSYQLLITSTVNESYESTMISPSGISQIDDIYAERTINASGDDGMAIYVNGSEATGTADYFRYTYEETYKIIAPRWTSREFEIIREEVEFTIDGTPLPPAVKLLERTQEEQVCFKTVASDNINIVSTLVLDQPVVERNSIRFINRNDNIMSHRYSILVKQYVQSNDSYAYYQNLDNFTKSESVFSEIQPGFLEGNIKSVNAENVVVGYFDVASVSEKRLFFNYEDFFPGEALPERYFFDVNCDRITSPQIGDSELDGPPPPFPGACPQPLTPQIRIIRYMKRYLASILVLSFLVASCIDTFDINAEIENADAALIIEATLTNEMKKHVVYLSRPSDFTAVNKEDSIYDPVVRLRPIPIAVVFERNAIVTVTDDLGNQYDFSEGSPGKYTSDIAFAAEQMVNYELRVTTQDGTSYTSANESYEGISQIDDVYAVRELNAENKEGVFIYVDGSSNDPDSKYFRYEYEETYKIIAPEWRKEDFVLTNYDPCALPVPTYDLEIIDKGNEVGKICYGKQLSSDIIQNSTLNLVDNKVVRFPVRFIDRTNYIISHRYSILVKQYAQSSVAYNFYNVLNSFSSSESVFSAIQPGAIEGNIQVEVNADNKVLGFFEVTPVVEKRMYFNYADLFPNESLPDYVVGCFQRSAPESHISYCAMGLNANTCPLSIIESVNIDLISYYGLNDGGIVGFETETFENALVIQAFLSNENKQHQVLLSRAIRFEESIAAPERNAQVIIRDDAQNEFSFQEIEPGTYESNITFAAIKGMKYTLEVLTTNGTKYISEPESFESESKVTNVYAERGTNANGESGLNIYVDGVDPSGSSNYYRYEYEETYKIIAPDWTSAEFKLSNYEPCNPDPDDPRIIYDLEVVPREEEQQVCYKTVASQNIIQNSSANLSASEVERFPVRFIPDGDFVLSHRYSINVKQFVQSANAFSYYQNLENFSSSSTVFSEIQPGFLSGNIKAEIESDNKVLGYFEVASVSEQRLFFDYRDFYPEEPLPLYVNKCVPFTAPLEHVSYCFRGPIGGDPCAQSLIERINIDLISYVDLNEGGEMCSGPYLVVARECGDCTELGQYDRFKVLPSEKVYVSTNTNVLLTGEYLFYKVYCLDDKTKQPSETSKIAYVELISEDLEVVFSEKIRLEKSQGQGDFFVPTTCSFRKLQTHSIYSLDEKRETYSKKSKVQLGLKNFRGAAGYGNYNISVRKKEAIVANGKHTPESFISWHEKQASNNTLYYDKITFGPEIEGELIKGQLRAKDGSSSTIGKKIGVSIPGKDFQLKVVRTDSTGVFHIPVRLDKLNDPYGGAYIEVVNLDEYTRFKTLDETIVELVPNVWTKKNKKGESVFKARSFDETYEESEFDALVYIDGVLVANPNDVLDFNTRTVARINTVREKYRMGGKTYFGMVNIETIEGNYFEQISGDGITKTNLTRTKPVKKYFAQTYNEESNRRIPDFRDQLLWKPDLTFEGTEMELSFYTSEIAGDYEVVLEGFSIYGRPVNIKKSFVVN